MAADNKWTVQKSNNVDRTHLVLLDSTPKKIIFSESGIVLSEKAFFIEANACRRQTGLQMIQFRVYKQLTMKKLWKRCTCLQIFHVLLDL